LAMVTAGFTGWILLYLLLVWIKAGAVPLPMFQALTVFYPILLFVLACRHIPLTSRFGVGWD